MGQTRLLKDNQNEGLSSFIHVLVGRSWVGVLIASTHEQLQLKKTLFSCKTFSFANNIDKFQWSNWNLHISYSQEHKQCFHLLLLILKRCLIFKNKVNFVFNTFSTSKWSPTRAWFLPSFKIVFCPRSCKCQRPPWPPRGMLESVYEALSLWIKREISYYRPR